MNILYLSHLSGASYAGPTYSVPKQIGAQSKIDHVFWYNAVENSLKEWEDLEYYHDMKEYPNESIFDLPEPFNKPDLIVVEMFYNMFKSKLLREMVHGEIPYVIIPRGELTKQAQHRKRLKKSIANLIACRKYAQKAAAIQYLTEQEHEDSGVLWNKNCLVIPNGITLPVETRQYRDEMKEIRCVSIGRIELYQKGLDLLIEACAKIKDALQEKCCHITICGPDKENQLTDLKTRVENAGLKSVIELRDGVYGDEKKKLLLDSDVFIIPSRFEGHPMALIEALSYGLPCVATTGSNMRENIEKYNAGWTADNTVDSIKKAMLSMLNDRDSYRSKGQNAYNLACEYDWTKLSQIAHDEYSKLLSD